MLTSQTDRLVPDDLEAISETVTVWGPSSLSNLGPGFDTLGCCIGGFGDRLEAWRVEAPGVHLVPVEERNGTPQPRVPLHPDQNTASVAAAQVLSEVEADGGLALRIHKQIPLGSGIGGSAASAVAGAYAAARLVAPGWEKEALVEAVLAGEEVASGSRHGDNVLPALFGGLVLTDPVDPAHYRRVTLPAPLHVALLLPEVPILTREARDLLPEAVPLPDAVQNAAALAFLIDALKSGDYETVGRCIMRDRLVEPVRAQLVPCYDAVRAAAMDAGALGCALTGSGPAMFALAGDAEGAQLSLEAMLEASRSEGIPAAGRVTQVDPEGVRLIEHSE